MIAAVRDQLDRGVRLPAVLPAAAAATCSTPRASTAPASCGSCWRIALPLVRPALVTAVLLTFIGPWNEFLWPFLITKQQDMQPLAVSLANYINNVAARAANPFGAILAGACVLAAPGGGAVHRLPASLHLHQSRFRREGLTLDSRSFHHHRPVTP